eukprot:TRINITY_DN609_c2_g1_i1.p1 TRINITY_DN609_c2_g1~~TRINITY_DN609_c2_g1_i1.p1  ORF type:complete len:183 (+),score=38.57 TRINITY_DN609_c2_g1_i1:70-618(+)
MSSLLLIPTMVVADASERSTAIGLISGGVFLLIIVVFVVCVLRAKASGEYDEVARKQAEREKRLRQMAKGASTLSDIMNQNVKVVDDMPHSATPPTGDWKCSICYESSPNPIVDGSNIECPDSEADASRPFVQFPSCDHTFHHTCCRSWFLTLSKKNKQFSCPLCRSVVDSSESSSEPTENV